MLRDAIKLRRKGEFDEAAENRRYWLSRPPEERVQAVDKLRREYYGTGSRLQRTARTIQRLRH